jgi:hypothetical protein
MIFLQSTMTKLWSEYRCRWRGSLMLRRLTAGAAAALLLCLLVGGLPCAMLAFGYIQLVFAALLPGEMVERNPSQRAAAFLSGVTRMLFFTGMMANASWPFALMGAAQGLCLLAMVRGERGGVEMSLLPLLSATGYSALGLAFGMEYPIVQLVLPAVLAVTLLRLLLRPRQTARQLAIRFHTA